MDTKEISREIFNFKPKKSNSIQFEFPEGTTLIECFQSLLEIFTEGMKILYGDSNGKVNLNQLSEQDFNYLNQYFHSFGYECLYKIYDYDIAIKDNIDFNAMKFTNKKITPYTRLEELFFPLRIDNTVYVIYFTIHLSETHLSERII